LDVCREENEKTITHVCLSPGTGRDCGVCLEETGLENNEEVKETAGYYLGYDSE
jgi:hypothetical protein